ncbi:cation:proton antiporter [Marinobacterium rhizophilum]|uniref:cation:proton antiporter domain-containing protein n=1 Tax=Marinobacterium rhizophilum TaxID=420402 RepID=UPI00036F219C|nr:cation:proton antiporter [Marinobacterium rhizophilum]
MESALHIAHLVAGIIALLLIAAVTLAVTERLRFPFTVALVLVGAALAEIAQSYPQALGPLDGIEISSGLILYVFLPTLVFESAFHLDSRQLRRDLAPVVMLAVPGLLVSTFIIGGVMALATPVSFSAALLLGAILSATDPVAVISLFKRLGAPRRLTVLVEGESLFNDATSIVLARVLVGILVAGAVSVQSVLEGVLDFVVVFAGGLIVGWLMALVTGYLLTLLQGHHFIEITLTTILAYTSFLIAEEVFHVSGVMATVAAALTFSGWGWIKVSPPVRAYLEHFWEYMAFIATALIFLMVGMQAEVTALLDAMPLLVWVILGMLLSRLVVVFGLMPLVERLPGAQPVGLGYKAVIYWGGLRGAIALAIVLSLPPFEYSAIFTTLVMGAVLFTLLVQGLSINALVHRLALDRPSLADRFARVEGNLLAKGRARSRIPELMEGGLFSGSIAQRLQLNSDRELLSIREELDQLRLAELDTNEERRLLYLRGFAEEQSLFIDMFNKGHICEAAFWQLRQRVALDLDTVRFQSNLEHIAFSTRQPSVLEQLRLRLLDRFGVLAGYAQRLRIRRVAKDYEIAWGRYQSCGRVLERFDELVEMESISPQVAAEVRQQYEAWHSAACTQLDQMAEQFPEFVADMQERLGQRLILLAEGEAIDEQLMRGTLPQGIAETLEHEMQAKLKQLRGAEIKKLRVEPSELLRKVPFLQDIPESAFAQLATRMRSVTVAEGENIITQGDTGYSVYLIARGVVRVIRKEGDVERQLATLMAGDFCGEMALLNQETRSATVKAVTPCSLYELRRDDLVRTLEEYPAIHAALEKAAQDRKRAHA